jgi:hypothetical protein
LNNFITATCTNLVSLNLYQTLKALSPEVLGTFELSKLECLDIGGFRLTTNDSLIELVKKCPDLRLLGISNCTSARDYFMEQLTTSCTKLEVLDLSGLPEITSNAFYNLSKNCQNIKVLEFSRSGLDNMDKGTKKNS